MTTDEILRRIELAKMFVKDAIEALEPVITSESIFRSESETIRKIDYTLTDLNRAKRNLQICLGSTNEEQEIKEGDLR